MPACSAWTAVYVPSNSGTLRALGAGMPNGPCAALLARVGGDERIFAELRGVFLDDAPKRLASIAAAIEAGDAGQIRRAAHAFCGVASVFDDDAVVAAARRLEQMAAAGDLAEGADLWRELEIRGRTLIDEVRACRF